MCDGEGPRPQSVMQACSQLSEIAAAMYPNQRVLEWDSEDTLLEIIDPYLLFYLRHSGHLGRLAQD